ncbi:MAG: phosphatidylglycerophosphatase A [Sphingobacteriia bacterium]|nr:phosphatidylglycerophosphatase A [Sphingobacteriia bacterium]
MDKKSKFNIHSFVSTFFYIGLIPKAPGTYGSIAAFPFVWIINKLIHLFFLDNPTQLDKGEALSLMLYHLLFIIALFIIGVITSDKYSRITNKKDPKEVVIDEVVGQWLLFWLCAPGIQLIIDKVNDLIICLIMLILFRIFDIIKPWPISVIDQKIRGGLGIMLDDIFAAIMGSIMFYAIVAILT